MLICLQDAIYRIKETFNKSFDEIYKQREQEIARINEKNQRISKILEDLHSNDEMWQPQMDSFEKPEKLLTVEENEVNIKEIWLTVWEVHADWLKGVLYHLLNQSERVYEK